MPEVRWKLSSSENTFFKQLYQTKTRARAFDLTINLPTGTEARGVAWNEQDEQQSIVNQQQWCDVSHDRVGVGYSHPVYARRQMWTLQAGTGRRPPPPAAHDDPALGQFADDSRRSRIK